MLHSSPPCTVPIAQWTVHVNVLAAGRTVTVSTIDNQSTVRLRAGDTLVVSLTKLHLPPKLSTAGVLVQRDAASNHDPMPCPSPPAPWTGIVIVTA